MDGITKDVLDEFLTELLLDEEDYYYLFWDLFDYLDADTLDKAFRESIRGSDNPLHIRDEEEYDDKIDDAISAVKGE